MKLIRDLVMLELEAPEETTKSGLVLTKTARDPVCRGKVVARGPGKQLFDGSFGAMQTSPGDVVLVNTTRPDGEIIKLDGKEYFLIPESSLSVILESQQ